MTLQLPGKQRGKVRFRSQADDAGLHQQVSEEHSSVSGDEWFVTQRPKTSKFPSEPPTRKVVLAAAPCWKM